MGSPQRKGQLATYLQKYADGVAPAAAFREAFGVSEAELEKELRRYVTAVALPVDARTRFADKVAIDKDWIVDQPSEADGQAAYAESAARAAPAGGRRGPRRSRARS